MIKEYINTINSAVKFFFIDISGYGKQVTFGEELKSKNEELEILKQMLADKKSLKVCKIHQNKTQLSQPLIGNCPIKNSLSKKAQKVELVESQL